MYICERRERNEMYRKCETTTPNSAIAKVFRCIHLNVTKILNEIQIQRIDKILWINCAWHLVWLSCCLVFSFRFNFSVFLVLAFSVCIRVLAVLLTAVCACLYVYSVSVPVPVLCTHSLLFPDLSDWKAKNMYLGSEYYTSQRCPTKFLQAH